MQISELLEKQRELDQFIIKNRYDYPEYIDANDKSFLRDRILALSVEVGEFANATRCFKYWSNKPSESKERLLDEYADILHFMLSVANTIGFTAKEIEQAYMEKHEVNYNRQKEGY